LNLSRIANAARVVGRVINAADAAWAVGDTANAGIACSLREGFDGRHQTGDECQG
jgi:hypothetical protein